MQLTLILLLVLTCGRFGADEPSALRRFRECRRAVRSGEIAFSVARPNGSGPTVNYHGRYASNGDRILEQRGDSDGWTLHSEGEPGGELRGISKLPQWYMRNADGYWSRQHTVSGAELWKAGDARGCRWASEAIDALRIGMSCDSRDLFPDSASQPASDDESRRIIRWEQKQTSGRYIVTGWTSSGRRTTWEIDPERGWNAERITVHLTLPDGAEMLVAECQNELRDFSGVWLPARATYSGRNGPLLVVTILTAKLNLRGDPEKFTGVDFGLEPGFSIAAQDFRPASPRGLRWSGDGLVSGEAWDELRKKGAKPGPTLEREMRGKFSPLYNDAENAQIAQARKERDAAFLEHLREQLWESYVTNFIERYGLDDEQRQKAELILRECQASARAYMDRKHVELESIFNPDGDGRGTPHDAERLLTRKNALLKPIREIFDNDLKPRLEKLPTREQRRKVETTPTSSPRDHHTLQDAGAGTSD